MANPEEHDFIKQVCAEDDAARVPPRLSDDPAVRLAECRGDDTAAFQEALRAATYFDEAAERVKFEDAFPVEQGSPIHVHVGNKLRYEGWLACAKSRAEVK